MYTPKFNQVSDRAILIEAMRSYSFAILFGPGAELRATHLPLIVRRRRTRHAAGPLRPRQRIGRRWPAGNLVVFPGPHSYVSPALYTEPLSVPTWNYIAIHAYGTLSLIEEEAAKNRSGRRTDPGPRSCLPRPLARHARRLSPHHARRHHGLSHPHRPHRRQIQNQPEPRGRRTAQRSIRPRRRQRRSARVGPMDGTIDPIESPQSKTSGPTRTCQAESRNQ